MVTYPTYTTSWWNQPGATPTIDPFGTSTNSPTHDLRQIKLFGCSVVDFNVSADWSSQGGSLSCRLIEDENYVDPVTQEKKPDRLEIPVLGSPAIFEVKTRPSTSYPNGYVAFQYIGIVDSFSRNATTSSKTYNVTLSSPLKILDATQVVMDGWTGFGSSVEGRYDLAGLQPMDFGHNNALIEVLDRTPGVYHWWNVANLINVFAIWENDDPAYRSPLLWDDEGNPLHYGGFGASSVSEDGMPLIKLMTALHYGINHMPFVNAQNRQRLHAGNLLYGRGNYDISKTSDDIEAYPFYYHFDAMDFYNQIVGYLGPQYRIAGQVKSIREIITHICEEANLEFYSYIDIYSPTSLDRYGNRIGRKTLQEQDVNWYKPAVMNWLAGTNGKFLDTNKINMSDIGKREGGRYAGTIRIKVINKNQFLNPYRPMSNIAYNIIGLETPDLKNYYWRDWGGYYSGIHPGFRPINYTAYGLAPSDIPYSDPLDSTGIPKTYNGSENTHKGFTQVGTVSIANGGRFPVATGSYGYGSMGGSDSGIFDPDKLSEVYYPRPKNSDISIKHNDVTTMKVVTGGYQSRLVTVPGNMLRHYWGDITMPGSDARTIQDTETDELGLNELSTRKVPVVTPILDPRDVDDYILIDMKSIFGNFSCPGVLQNGIYAASMLEVRCAMSSEESWRAFFNKYKFAKLNNLMKCFYPSCYSPPGNRKGETKEDLEKSTENINGCSGLGYVGVSDYFGLGNTFSLAGGDGGGDTHVDSFNDNNDESGISKAPADTGNTPFGLGINLPCAAALANIKKDILPAIFNKVKEIGDTHYGKSWYAPVPYLQTAEDLDGNNLVGDFKRSWELTNGAYVEPSYYYGREIPQTNSFISDGKVSAFVNYDHNFLKTGGHYDKSYVQDVTSLVGQDRQIFNFSEYDINELSISKYSSPAGIGYKSDGTPYTIYGAEPIWEVIHAAPKGVEDDYSFLPFVYDHYYNRALLPFSDLVTGQTKRWVNTKTTSPTGTTGSTYYTGMAPLSAGQSGTEYFSVDEENNLGAKSGLNEPNVAGTGAAACPGTVDGQLPDGTPNGYFQYDIKHGVPALTHIKWLQNIVPALTSLNYMNKDAVRSWNGRFGFPFVKFETSRAFLPVPAPNSTVGRFPSTWGFNKFVDAELQRRKGVTCPQGSAQPRGQARQFMITEDQVVAILDPFPACITPRSFSYPQVSTRYVYGPWMTSYKDLLYRGKVEYEQDDSLVPENFLIPVNFGKFGWDNLVGWSGDPPVEGGKPFASLSQTSGFTGMNLAGQGRANAIDNFGLFAIEEGSMTLPGAPGIVRIGDGLYGIPQISDIKINVTASNIETTYSFKTIAPRFGKNTRDLEKKLTKISNDIKKLKLR